MVLLQFDNFTMLRYPLRNIPVGSRDYRYLSRQDNSYNSWHTPSPVTSPDELIIRQRSHQRTHRRSPTKQRRPVAQYLAEYGYQANAAGAVTPAPAMTPPTGEPSARYEMAAGIRKRLLMTPDEACTPDMFSLHPEFTKSLVPLFKRQRKCASPARHSNGLRQKLSALSNQQLINVVSDIADQYSIQHEVMSSLPIPDIVPLIDNLRFLCRSIVRTSRLSRLAKVMGSQTRVKTHIENFKQACVLQGRQLQHCGAWSALVVYVKAAWELVDRIPVSYHASQNKTRVSCRRSLVALLKHAMKSGQLNRSEKVLLIKWCKTNEAAFSPLKACTLFLES